MVVLRTYFWLSAQGSLEVGLREPYVVLGIESRSATCKAKTLPEIPPPPPQELVLRIVKELSTPNKIFIFKRVRTWAWGMA